MGKKKMALQAAMDMTHFTVSVSAKNQLTAQCLLCPRILFGCDSQFCFHMKRKHRLLAELPSSYRNTPWLTSHPSMRHSGGADRDVSHVDKSGRLRESKSTQWERLRGSIPTRWRAAKTRRKKEIREKVFKEEIVTGKVGIQHALSTAPKAKAPLLMKLLKRCVVKKWSNLSETTTFTKLGNLITNCEYSYQMQDWVRLATTYSEKQPSDTKAAFIAHEMQHVAFLFPRKGVDDLLLHDLGFLQGRKRMIQQCVAYLTTKRDEVLKKGKGSLRNFAKAVFEYRKWKELQKTMSVQKTSDNLWLQYLADGLSMKVVYRKGCFDDPLDDTSDEEGYEPDPSTWGLQQKQMAREDDVETTEVLSEASQGTKNEEVGEHDETDGDDKKELSEKHIEEESVEGKDKKCTEIDLPNKHVIASRTRFKLRPDVQARVDFSKAYDLIKRKRLAQEKMKSTVSEVHVSENEIDRSPDQLPKRRRRLRLPGGDVRAVLNIEDGSTAEDSNSKDDAAVVNSIEEGDSIRHVISSRPHGRQSNVSEFSVTKCIGAPIEAPHELFSFPHERAESSMAAVNHTTLDEQLSIVVQDIVSKSQETVTKGSLDHYTPISNAQQTVGIQATAWNGSLLNVVDVYYVEDGGDGPGGRQPRLASPHPHVQRLDMYHSGRFDNFPMDGEPNVPGIDGPFQHRVTHFIPDLTISTSVVVHRAEFERPHWMASGSSSSSGPYFVQRSLPPPTAKEIDVGSSAAPIFQLRSLMPPPLKEDEVGSFIVPTFTSLPTPRRLTAQNAAPLLPHVPIFAPVATLVTSTEPNAAPLLPHVPIFAPVATLATSTTLIAAMPPQVHQIFGVIGVDSSQLSIDEMRSKLEGLLKMMPTNAQVETTETRPGEGP